MVASHASKIAVEVANVAFNYALSLSLSLSHTLSELYNVAPPVGLLFLTVQIFTA